MKSARSRGVSAARAVRGKSFFMFRRIVVSRPLPSSPARLSGMFARRLSLIAPGVSLQRLAPVLAASLLALTAAGCDTVGGLSGRQVGAGVAEIETTDPAAMSANVSSLTEVIRRIRTTPPLSTRARLGLCEGRAVSGRGGRLHQGDPARRLRAGLCQSWPRLSPDGPQQVPETVTSAAASPASTSPKPVCGAAMTLRCASSTRSAGVRSESRRRRAWRPRGLRVERPGAPRTRRRSGGRPPRRARSSRRRQRRRAGR